MLLCVCVCVCCCVFQAEDGIRDLVRSRGLGDVYKRQLIKVSMQDVSGGYIKIHYPENGLLGCYAVTALDLSLIHI